MRLNKIIIIFLLLPPTMSCENDFYNRPLHNKVENISIIDEVDDIPLPPPRLSSNFNSLNDWLVNICKTENPQNIITTYKFGLFKSEKYYIIYMVGLNKHEKNDSTYTSIDFKPKNMYFLLPSKEYQDLNLQQATNLLRSQLNKFFRTKDFNNSFLAEANSITADFNGEIIPLLGKYNK